MSAVLAAIGHNNPPEPTPFDLSKAEIESLYMEAKNWLDGEGVTTEAQAEAVSKLIDLLRKAEKAAEKVEEAKVEEPAAEASEASDASAAEATEAPEATEATDES